MTKLLLILGIQAAGLAYALVVGRSFATRDSNSLRLRRLGSALERATSGFHELEVRITLGGALAVAALMFALHLSLPSAGGRLGPLALGLGSALCVLLGAALTCVATRAALRAGVRGSVQLVSAASASLDRALLVAIRSGGAASLICEASSLLALLALFGVGFALAGGTSLGFADGLALTAALLPALVGFPLGAALAALVFQRAGGTYHTASGLGGDWSGGREGGLDAQDPRSPSLVGDLAGVHLGPSATRAALLFAGASASHVAVLALVVAAVRADATLGLSWILLPFLMRAFFVLANVFGLLAVRTEEMTSPSAALLRGQATTTLVGLAGVCGSTLWLAREHWTQLFLAGVLGALLAWLVALPTWLRLTRGRAFALRDGSESRLGAGAATLTGLGVGLESLIVPTLAIGASAALIWSVGDATHSSTGSVWAGLVGWTALLGTAPFAQAACSVATLAQSARGVGSLANADPEAQRRTLRLDEAQVASFGARAQLITMAAATCSLCALAIPALSGEQSRLAFGMLEPIVAWSGALGATLVLAYAGSCLKSAVSGGRELAVEIDRQLRVFPRERGMIKLPADFSPSYKACVEVCARTALRRLPLQVFGALILPVCMLFTLKWGLSDARASLAVQALVSFVLAAGLTGFGAALASDTAQASLTLTRRAGRTSATAESNSATPMAVADALGNCASPAVHALLLALSACGLALAPFIT